jgi:hypothetical protein
LVPIRLNVGFGWILLKNSRRLFNTIRPKTDIATYWASSSETGINGALSGSLGRSSILRLSSATHITHKLIDAEFPVGDDAFHQIADRYYPDETSVTQDWQVTDSPLRVGSGSLIL